MNIKTRIGLAWASGAVAGIGVGWILAERDLVKYYAELAAQEIQEVKQRYSVIHKPPLESVTPDLFDEVQDPAVKSALDAFVAAAKEDRDKVIEMMAEEGYIPSDGELEALKGTPLFGEGAEVTEDEEGLRVSHEEVHNAFEDNQDLYKDQPFVKPEDTSTPYVVPLDEFSEGEKSYDKISLTYYDETDVLCSENNDVVEDPMELLGVDWMGRFGDGSGDRNVVYVRNDNLEADFEVVLDHRSYEEAVLGVKPERKPPMRKMRERD